MSEEHDINQLLERIKELDSKELEEVIRILKEINETFDQISPEIRDAMIYGNFSYKVI